MKTKAVLFLTMILTPSLYAPPFFPNPFEQPKPYTEPVDATSILTITAVAIAVVGARWFFDKYKPFEPRVDCFGNELTKAKNPASTSKHK